MHAPGRAVPCRAVPPSAVLWVELVRICRVLFPNSIAGPLGERRAAELAMAPEDDRADRRDR